MFFIFDGDVFAKLVPHHPELAIFVHGIHVNSVGDIWFDPDFAMVQPGDFSICCNEMLRHMGLYGYECECGKPNATNHLQ